MFSLLDFTGDKLSEKGGQALQKEAKARESTPCEVRQ
jgi:hypothetical protein